MGMNFKSFETFDNKFIIDFNDELREEIRKFTPFEELPSYNIICARVLGTSYANFCVGQETIIMVLFMEKGINIQL